MVTDEVLGLVIVAVGGWFVGFLARRMNLATEGTPLVFSRNTM